MDGQKNVAVMKMMMVIGSRERKAREFLTASFYHGYHLTKLDRLKRNREEKESGGKSQDSLWLGVTSSSVYCTEQAGHCVAHCSENAW